MADKSNIHITFNSRDGNWRNVSEGASRPSKAYPTKAAAQAAGCEIAAEFRVEHVIHNKTGQIGSRHSYGSDPKSERG